MKVEANDIEEFFVAAGERELELRQIDALIRETVPELKRIFFKTDTITMIGYGMYHYRYASGREGDWPLIGLANQKNHISLYVCAAKNGKYLAEYYGELLGKVSTGKSCVRFKRYSDLNVEEVKKALKESTDWLHAQKTIKN